MRFKCFVFIASVCTMVSNAQSIVKSGDDCILSQGKVGNMDICSFLKRTDINFSDITPTAQKMKDFILNVMEA